MPTNLATLPPELRQTILFFLIEECLNAPKSTHYTSPGLAPYTTVCREWQEIIERQTFSDLYLCLDRLDEFEEFVVGVRRRRLRGILLHIRAPEYACDPCTQKESFDDKRRINDIFTETLTRLFALMNTWPEEDVVPGGIRLDLSVSSPSDLRNVGLALWQKRRWNTRDIGERRFADSAVDFVGQDDERRVVGLLKPVYSITKFVSEGLHRRAVMPAAYAEIISALPNLREAYLNIMKERRVLVRRLNLSQFGDLMVRWPHRLSTLVIRGNTTSNWRQLPHASISEADAGDHLASCLRDVAPRLRTLSIANLVTIKAFLIPLWPTNTEDRDILPISRRGLPKCKYLETVDLHYASLVYKIDWYKENADFNKHDMVTEFRQDLALAAARLAVYMPALKSLTISQRPMMWAGRHRLTYSVHEKHSELVFSSSFEFEPAEWVVDAWKMVAKKRAGKPLKIRTERLVSYKPDGDIPVIPTSAF